MIPLSPDAHFKCRTCGGTKHWTEFPVVDAQVNKRGTQCTLCKQIYYLGYQNSVHGIATKMWNSMNARSKNRDGRHATYADVHILFTQAQWHEWAEPKIQQFLKDHPGERPSVDRIDSTGHYEFSNIRIIAWTEHRRLKKAIRWERYVKYLAANPDRLAAFVERHQDKITGDDTGEKILKSVEVMMGRPLDFTEKSTVQTALAHPELLLNLMYLIDNAK